MPPSNEIARRDPDPLEQSLSIRNERTDAWIAVLQPVAELAAQVANTDFVPRALRNNPAAVTAAVLFGRELDMPPMHALSNIHMVEGKPTLAAETMRAQVLAAGHEIGYGEVSSSKVEVKGRRKGETAWTIIVWTLADAQRAGISNKAVWKSYPRQMLTARATAELCRLIFPDVTHGMRATEEVEDGELFGEVDAGASSGETATTRVARKPRGSAQAARSGASLAGSAQLDPVVPVGPVGSPPRSADIAPPPPPAAPVSDTAGVGSAGSTPGEGRDVPEDVTPAEPDPGEIWEAAEDVAAQVAEDGPVDTKPKPMHSAQTKALQARFKGLGWTDEPDDRESRLNIAAAIVGHAVDSFRAGDTPEHLTYDEANEILRVLAPCRSRDDVIALMVQITQDAAAEEEA
jgi:hypothetical protein